MDNIKIAKSITTESSFLNKTEKTREVVRNKIYETQEVVRKTMLAVQKYKMMSLIGTNELNTRIKVLETIYNHLNTLLETVAVTEVAEMDTTLNKLQEITNEFAVLMRTSGTEHIEDLLTICMGQDYIHKYFTNVSISEKFQIMNKYVHPISYKVLPWETERSKNVDAVAGCAKNIKKTRIVEDFMITESSDNLECFDLARTSDAFQTKVYGIKFAIHHNDSRKTLIICGIVDNLMTSCLNYSFVKTRLARLREKKTGMTNNTDTETFDRFLNSLSIKDMLIYTDTELYERYSGVITQVNLIKQKPISQVIKEFVTDELFTKRTTLINLLIKSNEHEYQYLAYLLYDLLTDDLNGNIDTHEQNMLFDSLPWTIKTYFREAMKQTNTYTNKLSNFDNNNKIPLEQQICLMKVDDNVKEKAMLKLKEIKSKPEDSGSKARQYLDGLMKIPFGIYKEEPILKIMDTCVSSFNDLIQKINASSVIDINIPNKSKYTSMEMRKYLSVLKDEYYLNICKQISNSIKQFLTNTKRTDLIVIISNINIVIKKYSIKVPKLCHSGKSSSNMITQITDFIDSLIGTLPPCGLLYTNINEILIDISLACGFNIDEYSIISYIKNTISFINEKIKYVNSFIYDIDTTLDLAIHGHSKAKRQVERIIGQWINGEKTGYCFGFEGPPGVGKTSLAKKGIANCLKDESGNPRPFTFIAIGGSSNGSTLDGHNYTYVGSTWGKIVDVLMENKCMNPIIFIDELDKVSNTEHGKEIIGILTHLIDQTQNDAFQDKYFNGINLDLSKALFVFSYNDPDLIDRILLDRIHRIKFEHLALDDKLVISKKYLLPEILKKMGLEEVIQFSDDVIEYIIEEWTCEPGVRKLKEILFEIVGEINLSILKNNKEYDIPVNISKDDIKTIYLKGRHAAKTHKVHTTPAVGLINGLWANSLGKGGVLPIEAQFYPCNSFLDLKLSGMQGDVMKESMNVAQTLAWSLLSNERMRELHKEKDGTKMQGIHIHVPEGATPKNGPSAGTAITVVLHSLFTNQKIRNDIAITGEMCLQGKVTGIGGLDLKILGGIKAGVKCFLFPKENEKDFNEFMEKYTETELVKDIQFIAVETIHEVLDIVYDVSQ